ncbi:MAG TPA: hypothetical protein PLB31_06335 [Fimbriimonadaceae bacterium]|nr:hypothetical protein [Armatimonadota bacterium]HCM74270.1 hypothetical protein [Armatimonadota bacterium]HRD30635.1 hypothetical protein [Fimbriimonadaceae bacterium]HRE93104.1 hypothetical protein [Fimbriimonadaceae bacterium]HRI74074.1 hypothetical protein [Fimbriimonadaceae bacterium]
MYRLPLILALAVFGQQTSTPPVLHPEADAFRLGDQAFLMAPARPIPAFDFVVSVQGGWGPSDWLLIEHRKRTPLDSTTRLTDQVPPATSYSFYNWKRNQLRPLPNNLYSEKAVLLDAVGDTAIIGTQPADESREFEYRPHGIQILTGRTMALPEAHLLVTGDSRFVAETDKTVSLLGWNEERRVIASDGGIYEVFRLSNPLQFIFTSYANGRQSLSFKVDVRTGESRPIENEAVRQELDNATRAGSVEFRPEADDSSSLAAYIAGDEESGQILNLTNDDLPLGSEDGRLPHELNSLGYVARDLAELPDMGSAGVVVKVDSNLEAAWFIRNGILFLRTIETMPLSEYEAYVREIVKIKAISMAKQTGVACNIYAADYDDHFPLNAGWKDALDPYMKNSTIMRRVTYLGDGQNYNDFDDPSEGVMGYVDTPYGRATFAWDSTTRWVPRP